MEPTEFEKALARKVIARLDLLIARVTEDGRDFGRDRFYEGFRNNVALIEKGIIGDFIELMNYQLGDSWEYGLDNELDSEVQDLVHGLLRFFPDRK